MSLSEKYKKYKKSAKTIVKKLDELIKNPDQNGNKIYQLYTVLQMYILRMKIIASKL